jgi:aerobic carbon-monoxide dehydrogenase large subunit
MEGVVGSSVKRVEDERLITGRGRFAADIALEGRLSVAFMRSSVPHARVHSVDTARAEAAPGVVRVFTAANLSLGSATLGNWLPTDMATRARPLLAADEVRHVGEAIAMVIAEDPYAARDAADLVEAELEPLAAVGDLATASAEGAPLAHADGESNLARTASLGFGDIDAAFADAPVIVKEELSAARICGAAMEPRAVSAAYDGETLTIWTSTQAVFSVRDEVARLLGMEKERVQVLAEDVGGGFGPKGTVYGEEVLVALAARELGRPVSWVAGRSEDGATTVHGHGSILRLELAADAEGQLRGLRGTLLHDLGAYPSSGAGQPDIIVPHLMSAYVLPALRIESHLYFTNTASTGFVRGGGRPLGNFGIERMMDRLADRLGLDRVEVRRRNFIQPSQMPYSTGYGAVIYDSGDYPRLLELTLEKVGYAALRRDGPTDETSSGRLRGVGVACCVESSGFGKGEPARVRIENDGRACLFIGSTPQGQGHQTMAAQVLADHLGWPLGRITVRAGDTAAVAGALLTAGSRTAIHVGNATARAGASARRRILELAADVLEANEADIVIEDGTVSVRGVPGQSVPLSEVIPEEGIEVLENWDAPTPTAYPSGCHAAVVEVDSETGAIRVVDYVIAHDAGRSINPMMVEGQIVGGFVHGLGYALFEEAIYEREGGFLSSSFLDYAIPSAPEVVMAPRLIPLNGETASNPISVKGVGESGTIPVPGAIASAVEDALRKRNPDACIRSIPITSGRVVEILARR